MQSNLILKNCVQDQIIPGNLKFEYIVNKNTNQLIKLTENCAKRIGGHYAYVVSHLHVEKCSITKATKTKLVEKRVDKTKENQGTID